MDENELEKSGLDFTPSSVSEKNSTSSSKRLAMFMFMGGAALFTLVTVAIMGTEQVVRSGRPPELVVQPSNQANQIIPPIEFRMPDPEPEPEEDLTRSQAFDEANRNLPGYSENNNLQDEVLRQLALLQQMRISRSVVPAYGRNRSARSSAPFISARRRDAQTQRMQAAAAPTTVSTFGSSQSSQSSNLDGVDALDASLSGGTSQASNAMGMDMGDSSSSNFVETTAMSDPNGWSRKDAFANTNTTTGNEYSRHNVMFRRSDFEVKAGTIIPCVLISGLNSDLPGNAVAQVSENVWDTATGRYLLIPRGSRLVGTYDNQVTYGQNRALVVWSRLIFPDGSSLTLDNLKGTDQSGYAGFKGQVNKHWGSLISSALLVSLIGAGVELAEPNNNNNNNNHNNNNNRKNVGNILSERVATGIADALTQIIQREVQRQPTIKVKPGYRFVVMAQRDMVFPGSWRR